MISELLSKAVRRRKNRFYLSNLSNYVKGGVSDGLERLCKYDARLS